MSAIEEHFTPRELSHLMTSPGLAGPRAERVARRPPRRRPRAGRARRHPPHRFAGFAALPMQHQEAAAAELRRAVTQLGLRGALPTEVLRENVYVTTSGNYHTFEVLADGTTWFDMPWT